MEKKLEEIFCIEEKFVDRNGNKINPKPLGLHASENELNRNSITEERVRNLLKEAEYFFPKERSGEINSYLVRECKYKGLKDHNSSLIDFYKI